MKKELVARNRNDDSFNLYSSSEFELANCLPPNKDGVLWFGGELETCRELFIDELRTYLNCRRGDYWGSKEEAEDWSRKVTIHLRHASILFVWKNNSNAEKREKTRKDLVNWLNSAKRVLNSIEAAKGWRKTVIEPVKPYKNQVSVFIFWVSGSYHWIKAPQLYSLYLLIIRLMRNKSLRQAKTFNEMIDILGKVKGDRIYDLYDGEFVVDIDKWGILLANEEEIYKDRKMSDNYLWRNYSDGDGVTEGILRLCDGDSVDLEINRRFQEVIKNGKRFIG